MTMRQAINFLFLSLALCAPAAAQKMGGTNHSAPMLTQSFTANGGSVDFVIEYTAITWSGGEFMAMVMDKDNGGRHRAHVNRNAPEQPLGSLRADTHVKIGDTNLPKGMYALYFTIDDDLKWSLNARDERDEKKVYTWELDLGKAKKKSSRLRVLVAPGENPREASIELAFGNMSGDLAVTQGSAPKPQSKPTTRRETK